MYDNMRFLVSGMLKGGLFKTAGAFDRERMSLSDFRNQSPAKG